MGIIDKNRISPIFGALSRLWYGITLFRVEEWDKAEIVLMESREMFSELSNQTQVRIIDEKYLKYILNNK